MSQKQDPKEVAYTQPYEVNDICKLYKIKKKAFLLLVKQLEHEHSREDVEKLLEANGFVKHPKTRKPVTPSQPPAVT